MISSPVIEIDLHGLTAAQAVSKVTAAVRSAGKSVYRIRCIHGFHGGTRIRDALIDEFSYGREPKVIRIVPGDNQGITELVLREY